MSRDRYIELANVENLLSKLSRNKELQSYLAEILSDIGFSSPSPGSWKLVRTAIDDPVLGTNHYPQFSSLLRETPIVQRLRQISSNPLSNFGYTTPAASLYEYITGAQSVLLELQARQRWEDQSNDDYEPDHFRLHDYVAWQYIVIYNVASIPFSYVLERYIENKLASVSDANAIFGLGAISSAFSEISKLRYGKDQQPGSIIRSLVGILLLSTQPITSAIELEAEKNLAKIGNRGMVRGAIAALFLGRTVFDNDIALYDLIHGPHGVCFTYHMLRSSRDFSVGIPFDFMNYILSSRLSLERYSDEIVDVSKKVRTLRTDTLDPLMFRDIRLSSMILDERLSANFGILYGRKLLRTWLDDAVLNGQFHLMKLWASNEAQRLPFSSNPQSVASTMATRIFSRKISRRSFIVNEKLMIAPELVSFGQNDPDGMLKEFGKQIKRELFTKCASYIANDVGSFLKDVRVLVKKYGSCLGLSIAEEDLQSITFVSTGDAIRTLPLSNQMLQWRDGRPRYSAVHLEYERPDYNASKGVVVYAPDHLRPLVALSCELTLYKSVLMRNIRDAATDLDDFKKLRILNIMIGKHKFMFRPRFDMEDMVVYTYGDEKAGTEDINDARNVLLSTDFYNGCEVLVPYNSDLAPIVESLKAHQGSLGGSITAPRIQRFISQFPPSLRAEAKGLLKKIVVFKNNKILDVVDSVSSLVEQFDAVSILPLSKTSGLELTRGFENELKETLKSDVSTSLKEILDNFRIDVNRTHCVVLVDDNIASGRQTTAQLSYWLEPEERRNITEGDIFRNKDDNLSLDDIEFVKNIQFVFVYIVAKDVGVTRVQEFARDKGLKRPEIRWLADLDSYTFDPTPQMREFLREVGHQVYNYKTKMDKKPPDDAKAMTRALGFDNWMGTFCFEKSVPTALLTALWCPGAYKSHGVIKAWRPIFFRVGTNVSAVLD